VCDGSLRDIYVLHTSRQDWQRLLDDLHVQGLPMSFRVGEDDDAPVPRAVAEVFARQHEESHTLSIKLSGMMLNTHYVIEDEIELDLDPQELQSEDDFARLLAFMKRLARLLDQPAILTPENLQEYPWITVNPDGGVDVWSE
jgi:hypothetical protein